MFFFLFFCMEPDFICADIFNVFSGGYPCGKPDVTHTQSERYFLHKNSKMVTEMKGSIENTWPRDVIWRHRLQ